MVMKFDLETPTAEDMRTPLLRIRTTPMVGIAELLAKVAVECPTEWGDPREVKTYSSKPFREVLSSAYREYREAMDALSSTVEGVEFDLSQITPEQFDQFLKEADSSDPEKVAAALTRFVKKCPKSWGAPDKPETYLKLHYYTQFRVVANMLREVGKNELENFLKMLTSA